MMQYEDILFGELIHKMNKMNSKTQESMSMAKYEIITKNNTHMYFRSVAEMFKYINTHSVPFMCINLKTGYIFKFDVGGKYNYVGRICA